jgi:hypothetical protein
MSIMSQKLSFLLVIAACLLLGLAFAYVPGGLPFFSNKRVKTVLRVLPLLVGAGVFGAVVALVPSYTTDPWIIGSAGALAGGVGAFHAKIARG